MDARPPDGRNVALDGIRGLAALSVALAHCVLIVAGTDVWSMTVAGFATASPERMAQRALMLVFPGDAAVMVFFVLSGHVLWSSFARKQMTVADLADYASARLFRLLPIIVVTSAALALFRQPPLLETVANMLLLSTSLNGVLWSLQVEMVGSALIFAVWLLARDDPRRVAAALCVVAAVVPFARGTVLVYMPAFVLGALLHHVPAPAWANRAVPWLGLALLLLPSLYFSHGGVTRVFEILGATAVIGWVSARRPPVLQSRPVHFLGAISYPLYVVHPLCVAIMLALLGGDLAIAPLPKILVYSLLSVGLAIPLAWLLHVAIEMPALRLRPRFARNPAAAARVTPASSAAPARRSSPAAAPSSPTAACRSRAGSSDQRG